ncbi:MAG: hypothetical protein Q4C95_09515 [Planctomycetia bacterium]|nr:hypothetical protein [Planctomycetia bacterium]
MRRKTYKSFLWNVAVLIGFLGFSVSFVIADDFVQIKPHLPNNIDLDPTKATFVRVCINASNDGTAPCIDELEFYQDGNEQNLAFDKNVKATASSIIGNYPQHQIRFINDGRYGNSFSWIPAIDDKSPWIQLQWPEPISFNKIVFSRDRAKQYQDRVPIDLEVLISNDGENWTSATRLIGTVHSLSSVGGRTNYLTHWFQNVPNGNRIDLIRDDLKKDSQADKNISDYDRKLRLAILGEENAWLKMVGSADTQRNLLQRHYPEHVEPQLPYEDILPLPTTDSFQNASQGTVRVSNMENWNLGPLVQQSVAAYQKDNFLHLKIEGNRFLSDHIAMISTEDLPTRGFVTLIDNQIQWKAIDPFADRTPNSLTSLEGSFDKETLTFEVRIPLDFFPEYQKRGIYVSLGIGGNNTMPGGHPIHFIPADFSIQPLPQLKKGSFSVLLSACSNDIELADTQGSLQENGTIKKSNISILGEKFPLKRGESKIMTLPVNNGIVGPEIHWNFEDAQGIVYQINLLHYDPCFRAKSLLGDMILRQASSSTETIDLVHFKKTIAIPGTLNPLYTDIDAELTALDQQYHELLFAEPTSEEIEDPFLLDIFNRYNILVDEYQKTTETKSLTDISNRDLFWKFRMLKRELFLTNEEFEPLTSILFNKRHPFHPSHNYSDLVDSQWRPGGAVSILTIPMTEEGRLEPEKALCQEIIQAKDGVIRNPSPSFDTEKIYYSHRDSQNEYFKIREFDRKTGQTRQISDDGPFHDFWPTLLPDNTIAFVSTRCAKRFICWIPQAFTLHKMNLDGSNIQQLSFANLSEFGPSVKDDGRIIWTRSEYVDKGADYGHTLWTIRIDGTMPELVFGNTINLPQGYANGRDVPQTREVCTTMISHFGDLNGPISLLDTTKSPHDPTANHNITPEVPWPGFWAAGETFREAFPITKDVILVAHAPQQRFGIFLLDRFGNREMISMNDEIDSICPQPLQSRETPPVLLGSCNQELAEQGLGQLSVANVYRGLEGQVEPGSAKYLRISQEMPATLEPFKKDDGSYPMIQDPFEQYYASPTDILRGAFGWPSFVAKGVIGTVEIEDDGSVDFLVPAEKVIFFQLLDENFNEIQRMRSVVQLQPGEQRSCIGCHESRLSTPETSKSKASLKPGQKICPPPWGEGAFWFEKTVQPVLDKNCTECHNAETLAENPRQLDLTDSLDEQNIPTSYRQLIQSGTVHYFDYLWGGGITTKVDPYSFGTFKSSLWNILKDDNHAKKVQLSKDEEHALKCWIDLNVPLWGDYSFRPLRKGEQRPQDKNRWNEQK